MTCSTSYKVRVNFSRIDLQIWLSSIERVHEEDIPKTAFRRRLLRRVESRIRLYTHAKRQGRERDSKYTARPGPTNGKEGRGGADKTYYDLRDMYGGHVWRRILLPMLPRSSSGYDTNWVIVDRLTKDEISLRRGYRDNCALSRYWEAAYEYLFFAYFVGKILGGDQLLVILCGYGTKSLEIGETIPLHDYAKDQDIKFKDKDIKSKIKIKDHNHVKGTAKEFPRTQGSKIQDAIETGDTVSYDQLYVSLAQIEPHVQASKAKRATRNHDPLALITHSNASSSQSHARYGGNGNRNARIQNMNQAFNEGNGLTQNDERHCARDCQKLRVRDAKYLREQMLLAMKDEAGSNLKDEENDFMLDNSYGDETLKELTAIVIMMARIQPVDDNDVTEPNYDLKVVSELNA
ncbi:hypothetical protein Tco_1410100 [Tanacetum coccineum]